MIRSEAADSGLPPLLFSKPRKMADFWLEKTKNTGK